MAKEKVGFALYGLGRIGELHIENLLTNTRVDLRWIIEGNATLAAEVMSRHGIVGKINLATVQEIPTVLADKGYVIFCMSLIQVK